MRKYVIPIAGLTMVAVVFSGCGNGNVSKSQDKKVQEEVTTSSDSGKSERDIFAMDTYMTVTAYGDNSEDAVDKAEKRIEELDSLLSTGDEGSEVYALNQSGHGKLSEDGMYLLKKSLEINKSTDGAFNPAIYPIMELWGFTDQNYKVPDEAQIKEKLKLTDVLQIKYDESTGQVDLETDGMKHLENLWFRTGEIAFAVTEGFKEPHGNTLTAARYADIAGKKITKITYIVRGGADVVYNTDILCKKLLDESAGYGYTGEGTVYADGATVTMTGKTPEETNYSLSSVEYGNKTLTAGTDYTYENNVLTVKATENTGVGNYTLTYSDKDYQDIYATVLLSSSMKSDEISIADNTLSITNKDVSVQNYLADGIAADASSDKADSRGEYDKGAFDVVTRATTNHGLHRGSYQCMATIYDTDGKVYEVSSWNSASEAVLTNGQVITFERGAITYTDAEGSEKTAQMDHYEVSGIKYVPVAVKTEDFEAFCQKYPVVKKGEKISGGFSEANLVAYSAEAEVTADTNGLKTATKNEDGTFSFSARQNGTDSGIAGASLKKAENITVTVKEANGSYGEFLRVDLTGDGYGDLGSNMQAVVWKYYGNDSEYKNALVTYGTKFASDNWMHKAMGVQLGLTDSLRCKLPAGTDGTGYWTLTVYALGHEDYTTQFEVKAENIVEPTVEEADKTALEEAIAAAKALVETDYTPESWASMPVELGEAEDELAAPHTQATVDEAVEHLNAAVAALEKKPVEPVITSIKDMDITLSAT